MNSEWTSLLWQIQANRFLLVRRKSFYYLKQLAQNAGLLQGQRSYRRFVIVCRPRSGSNFLRSLLNSHSRLIAFSEIFRGFTPINWGLPGYGQRKISWDLYSRDPVRFLTHQVFCDYPSGIAAVGFKLMYEHASDEQSRHLWSHLQQDDGLLVIHLKRRNYLRSYISLQRAKMTDQWVNMSGQPLESPPLTLDPAHCFKAFEEMRLQEFKTDRLFHANHVLNLYYEDLVNNRQREIQRIQNFLGLPVMSLSESIHRISLEPPSTTILNYEEIKQAAHGTQWARFFDDDAPI
jgi:LPS sulfotransferase NodH